MDLTRFDFHASKFMHSLDVMAMTDAEVGQYILLLCQAWLTGQETELPTDEGVLARIARTTKVSQKVLAKFPIVQTERGERRRNDVLFAEWNRAKGRFDRASQKSKVANTARWNPSGIPQGIPVASHKESIGYPPNQSIPIQTNPDQTKKKRIQETIEAEDSSIALRKEEQARKNQVSENFHKNHVL